MSTPVPTRFSDEELATIDGLVALGIGVNRSDVIRLAVAQLHAAAQRARTGRLIVDAYREVPQSASVDTFAMANAIALTEAEPW
jgi:Arc/MetJ-type ribon-helix-helix transcriptional regulator